VKSGWIFSFGAIARTSADQVLGAQHNYSGDVGHNATKFLMSKIVGVQVNARSHSCFVEQSFPPALAFQRTREAPMDKLKGAVIALSFVALAQLIAMYPVESAAAIHCSLP